MSEPTENFAWWQMAWSLPKTADNAFQGRIPIWTLPAAEYERLVHMKAEVGYLQ